MPRLADIVQRTSDKVIDGDIDVGLDAIVAAIEREPTARRAVDTASVMLRDRIGALKQVRRELKKLEARVAYVGEILPFTEDGWPERRDELAAEFEADPLRGLASWLEDWFEGVSRCRHDALDRMMDVPGFPNAAGLLLDRCATTSAALHEHDWDVARPLLAAGAAGIDIFGVLTPSAEIRREVRLVLARLAIETERYDEADELLESLGVDGVTAGVTALRARLRRRRSPDEPGTYDAETSVESLVDLDVAVDLIEHALQDKHEQLALDTARTAIALLPVLVDFEAELGRLVSPPPTELLVAVAERALREGDLDIHLRALERAESQPPFDGPPMEAIVAELRIVSADERNLPVDQRIAWRMFAADARIATGELDLAAEHFLAAHELDPADPDIALRLADCRIGVAAAQPLSSSRSVVEQALEMIVDSRKRTPLRPDPSWSYLAEAQARGRLAQSTDPADLEHGWLAFIAVCRSIAHEPQSSDPWSELSIAAVQISLYRVADLSSVRALELESYSERLKLQRVHTLINLGDNQQAWTILTALEPTLWNRALEGVLEARFGRYDDAIATLRAASVDREWSGAASTLVTSLLLTDRISEALSEAAKLKQVWSDRLDEFDGVLACAAANQALGFFPEARELADGVSASDVDGTAQVLVATSDLLMGDAKAVDALASCFAETSAPFLLDAWHGSVKSELVVLARRHEVDLPALDVVDVAVDRRQAELDARRDPLDDFDCSAREHVSASALHAARSFAIPLIMIARGDYEGAAAALERSMREWPDDPELQQLAGFVAALIASAPPKGSHVREPTSVLHADDEVSSWLRRLLDVAADAASRLVEDAIRHDPYLHEQVLAALEELSVSQEYADRAISVLTVLELQRRTDSSDLPAAAPEPAVKIVLPASWFDGYEDPVNDHPLFLRFLPSMRLRAGDEVPPIIVGVDGELEPDGYRILVLGNVCEEGRVPPQLIYTTTAALALFGDRVRKRHELPQAGLVGIVLEPPLRGEELAQQLVISALEVVIRRTVATVGANLDRIAESSGVLSEGAGA